MDYPQHVIDARDQLVVDLMHEDEMGAVIRTHLHIEQMLVDFVKKLLPYPEHLKPIRLDYDDYVSLSLSLGLHESYGKPFRALGKLRNDFAHKLGFKLDLDRVKNFYETFAPEDKEQVHKSFARMTSQATAPAEKFDDLEPLDQFRVIAITLWAIAQAAHLHRETTA